MSCNPRIVRFVQSIPLVRFAAGFAIFSKESGSKFSTKSMKTHISDGIINRKQGLRPGARTGSFRRCIKSLVGKAGLASVVTFGCVAANATPLPDDVQLTVTSPEGQTQTLNLHRRSVRASTFDLKTWDSTNGYVNVTPTPEVRTFRGTVSENPNALIYASIDTNNLLRAYCFDMDYSQNARWYMSADVNAQLGSPVTPAAMPAQTIAAPRSGSTGPALIGRKVPTGTAPNGVNYGDIVEFELGVDLNQNYYNSPTMGHNVDNVLAAAEVYIMAYEQMMLRSALVRTVVPTMVIRKEPFYTEGNLGQIYTEWMTPALRDTKWDLVWSSLGHSSACGIGHGQAASVCGGVLFHEGTHSWGASHLCYQGDSMGGNFPSVGPFQLEEVIKARSSHITAGQLPTAQPYPDPVHPYTYPDVARVTMNTPQDIDVLANDWDVNGDSLTVSSFTTTTTAGGTVTLVGGKLHYVPATNFVGKDEIVYTAQDSSTMGLKSRDIVHIEVVNNDLMARYSFEETSGTTSVEATGLGPIADLNGGNFATDSVVSPLGRGVRAWGVQTGGGLQAGIWSGIILGGSKAIPAAQPLLGSAFTPFEDLYNKRGCGYDMMDGNYTFSTWFRGDSFPLGDTFIVSKWWTGDSRVGWDMRVRQDPATLERKLCLYWRVFDGTQGAQSVNGPAYDFIPSKWYHAACVFDRTNGEVRLYLNGAKIGVQTNAFPTNGFIFNGRAPLTLGTGTNRRCCFDDTRIYSKALSDSDMQTLYAEPGSAPRFLESSLNVAIHTGIPLSKTLWPWVWTGGDDSLTFSKTSGPGWLNVTSNGEMVGTPGAGDIGTSATVVRITDSSGAHADITVNFTVSDSLLRARWLFDEGSGTTAADSSGNGNTATLHGATWALPSRQGFSSLATDSASAQYAQASSLDTTGGFTIVAWIKPSVFVGKHTIISQQGSYAFKVNGSTLDLEIPSIADHNTPSGPLVTSGPSIWQHVAISFQPGATGGAKFYVNGVLKCTLDASTFNQSGFPTLLGKTTDWSNQNYSGGLDDVRVYDSILSAEEIGDLVGDYPSCTPPAFISDSMSRVPAIEGSSYSETLAGSVTDLDPGDMLSYSKVSGPAWLSIASNGALSGTPATGDYGANAFTVRVTDSTGQTDTSTLNISVKKYLAAHWKFDEGTGTTAADSSATGNNATFPIAGGWGVARVGPTSLSLNGTDSYYASAASIVPGGGFTLAAWIKPAVLTGDRSLVTQRSSYIFKTSGSALVLSVPGVADHSTASGLLVAGQWQHVAVSFNPGTTGGANFYINGALVASVDASALVENSEPTIIGRTAFVSTADFSGNLDDIRAYGVPLDATAIANLYNSYPAMTAPTFTNDPMTGTSWGGYGAYAGTLAGSATDADGDPGTVLKYSKVSGPSWLSVAADGTLGGVPPSAPGLNSFVVKVTDSTGLTDTATLNITDISNVRPTFTSNPITGGGATEDSAYSGSIGSYGTDANPGSTLTYGKISGPAWLNVASNGILSGTPDNSNVGANAFTVSVIDQWGAFTTAPLNITVANTNDAPGFTTNPIVKAATVCYVAYSGSLAGDASDPDVGDTLTFSKVSGPTWLGVASNGALSGTPADSDGGLNTFIVRVADAAGASATATLQITVSGVAWSNPVGGSWISAGNWNGGVIASGSDKIANFATLDLTADATVTLDGARTIGGLTFGDTAASNSWTLNAGSGGPLTLDVSTGSPMITVNNQTASIGASLTGNDGLTKAGAGILALNGSNTYTGGTLIQGGTVAIGNLGALGTGNVALGNTATLLVNTTGNLTNANTVSVASGSSATIDLGGNATCSLGTGIITVGGNLTVTRSAMGSSQNVTTLTGALAGAGNLVISSQGTVGGTPFRRMTFSSPAAFDNFTGGIHIQSGANLALFNGTLTNANQNIVTLDAGGFITLLASTTTYVGSLNGAGTITKNATFNTATLSIAAGTFSGIISETALTGGGPVAVSKTGTGTLTLGGSNSYTGPTTVIGGTLNVLGSLGATPATVQTGATLSGTGTLGGAVAVQSGGTLAPGVSGTGTLTINSSLGLAGTASMQIGRTGGTLSVNKIAGITTVTYGGTLLVTNTGADPLQAGNSFRLFAASIYNGNFSTITLPSLSAGLVWDTSSLKIDGTISVETIPVAVDDEASGAEDSPILIAVLDNDSDADSDTLSIQSVTQGDHGTVEIADDKINYTPAANWNGTDSFTYTITDNRGGTAGASVTVTVVPVDDAPVFTSSPFSKAGAISQGTYSGSIAGDATDIDAGDTIAFSKVSGPAWLNVASNGTLSGTPTAGDVGLNIFTVRATDTSGASSTATLQITVTVPTWTNTAGGSWINTGNWNAGVIATGADNTANFATLDLTADATVTLDGARTIGHMTFGDITASNNWTLNTGSGGPLTLDVTTGNPLITVNNQTATIGVVLAGNDGLTKAGTGILVLGATNTYTGGTSISGGTLTISNINALGTGNALSVPSASSGVLDLQVTGTQTLNTGTVNLDGTLRIVRSGGTAGSTVVSGGLSGAGGLQIDTSPGAITTSPYHRTSFGTGTTAFDNFSGSISVLSGGNLALFNGTLTNANSNTVDIASGGYVSLLGGSTTYIGGLSGAGTITKNSGSTNATLSIASGIFSGTIVQNALSGGGTVIVTKSGSGTLTLSGANTYTGATTVSGGTLSVTGSLAGTTTTVQTGGTLGGTGTLGGAVTVQSGGTIAPGTGGIGTLTLGSKTLSLSGTAAMQVGRSSGSLSNDKVTGITTVTYGGTLTVTDMGTDALQAGDAFRLFSATTYTGTFGTVTLPTLASGLTWNTSRLTVDGYISVQGTLPSGWASADIGSAGVPGGSNYASGLYMVSGSGAAIGGTADAFQSVTQSLTGDGEIRARITSQTNTNAAALAGVMLRDGSTAGNVNAIIGLTPGGLVFQARSTSSGTTTQVATATANTSPNNWVRLTRCGTLITAYVSADGIAWTNVGSTSLTMGSTISASLAVTSHDNTVSSTAVFDNVSVTPYPSPWVTADIGTTGLAGRSEYFNGVHTLNGAGVVGGAADGLRYTYQTLSADGQIVARVPAFANTGTGSRIGVMIRDTLASNSRHVFIGTDGSGAFTWASRATTGGSTTTSNSGTATAPNVWVKLVRSGNDITASTSTDGTTWNAVGTVTITMATNCYIGLTVGSGNTTGLNASAFDNVNVTP